MVEEEQQRRYTPTEAAQVLPVLQQVARSRPEWLAAMPNSKVWRAS
jgi:hypothetical protein